MKKWASILIVMITFLPGLVYPFDQIGKPEVIPGFADPTAQIDFTRSVVNINVLGTGLGLYPDENGLPKYGVGVFGMSGSGFMVGNYIITAAHVVNPTDILIRTPDGTQFYGPLINVTEMSIIVSGSPAKVFHINVEQDYAILVFAGPCSWAQDIGIRAANTWDWLLSLFGFAQIDKIHEGDAVYALVRVRDEEGNRTGLVKLVQGVIISGDVVVPPGYEGSLPWFNMNDFTMKLEIRPGDSGSPVIMFEDGVPYLVGIARAAGLGFSFATRIDFIKLVTESTM